MTPELEGETAELPAPRQLGKRKSYSELGERIALKAAELQEHKDRRRALQVFKDNVQLYRLGHGDTPGMLREYARRIFRREEERAEELRQKLTLRPCYQQIELLV